ncbi:major facilitator superfamily domain-containing protein 6-like [Rhinatrema bivittatum]|uniref:major facilitator superfamily domain-containing protein 6-like n=1 Tax=Rhinatrema bivittatum TaxID=194408 RepID=UPI00112AD57C|nr:major facilitator superfamily domain-containing protein 6-like [Rhinatrema bivittatum]XP_029456195.1 major facilitator superfamily domain-containing protein 6-like [Rhinatrema bivittatum]XP_029456196.1 major facilitator superfamily domain-containing protein 6-like [Rhinatrema bivittatum]
MSGNKQWDISKALVIASIFHFFHNAGKSCVIPFLTIYFRQLGLTAPFVGIIIGIKHLIGVIWAPLCSYFAKTHSKRRVLIAGSLLSSMGAGLLLTLIPPLSNGLVNRYCNINLSQSDRVIATGIMDLNNLTDVSPKITELHSTQMANKEPVSPASVFSSRKMVNPAWQEPADLTKDRNNTIKGTTQYDHVTWTATPVGAGTKMTQQYTKEQDLEPSLVNEVESNVLDLKNNSPFLSVISRKNKSAEEEFSGEVDEIESQFQPFVSAHVSKNASKHRKIARDTTFEVLEDTSFLDGEHKIFLMVLGAVALWELLASPLEWTADDSLYEYLDFVDAADRHGRLWIWAYLGASGGACGIALLVDQLNCFLSVKIPRMAVHFYGYAAFITLTLLVSIFYPIHISKKNEHANKTVKAMGLLGSDGRIILFAVTVFLTGAVGSTADNFLFWQMQDKGSSELYMGASVAVALTAEILLYVFKNKILKIVSNNWIVALSLSCLALQLLYYSFLWTSWAVLPIQILSAFSNGALWWAVDASADDVATPGTERSLQLVLHGLSRGCGASLGSFASGFIISSFNLVVLYRACSLTLILWLVLFLIVQSRLPRQKRINYSRLLAADNSDLSDSDDEQEKDWLVKAMKDESSQRSW